MASKNINDLESLTSISGGEIFPVSVGNGEGTKKVSMATVKSYCSSGIVSSGGSSIDLSSVPSDIIPNQDSSYLLGSSGKAWEKVYADNVITPSISSETNNTLTINSDTEINGGLSAKVLNSETTVVTYGGVVLHNSTNNSSVTSIKKLDDGTIQIGNHNAALGPNGLVINLGSEEDKRGAYFNNKLLITEEKLNSTISGYLTEDSIVDSLEGTETNKALSANQGNALNAKIANVENSLKNKANINTTYTKSEIDSMLASSSEPYLRLDHGEILEKNGDFEKEELIATPDEYVIVLIKFNSTYTTVMPDISMGAEAPFFIAIKRDDWNGLEDYSYSSLNEITGYLKFPNCKAYNEYTNNSSGTYNVNGRENLIMLNNFDQSLGQFCTTKNTGSEIEIITFGYIDSTGEDSSSNITIDDSLNSSSTNPVQNKVITTALNDKQNIISDITTIRNNASKGLSAYIWGNHGSAGYATETYVQNYVANNAGSNITVDSSLSSSSTNPVQNKVITAELNKKLSKTLSSGEAIKAYVNYNGSLETVIEFPAEKNENYGCYKSIFGSTNSILTLKSNHDPIVEITGQKNTYTLMHSGNNLPRLDYGTIITVSYSRMAKIILKDYDNGGTTKTNIDLSKCKIVLLKFKSIPDYDNVEMSSTTPIPSDNPTSTGQATNEINYYEKTVFVALSPTSTGSLTDIDNWTTNDNPSKTIIGYLRFPGCDFYNQYKYTNNSTSGGNSIFNVSARTNLNLINNYNPSLGQFCTYAESTISAYGFEVGTSTASDANLKNIIGEVNLSLDQIANAPAIQFTWKNGINNRINAGTIAQYWREVLPEAVHGEDGSLSMNYGATALISAISLAKIITKQNEEIKLLKEEIENLKNKS